MKTQIENLGRALSDEELRIVFGGADTPAIEQDDPMDPGFEASDTLYFNERHR